ncbi:protocadherin beta-11-like [Heliangelus exortis]|uniref:protocadherin beta-11-like n=1 Tax=Heliangelus exortis TaxID=472823 RepID=UPI003A901E5D
MDMNDNLPTFIQNIYTMMLSKNEPVGTILGHLHATDICMRYMLGVAPGGAPNLASFVSLDMESRPVWAEVLVTASDAGSPPLSANVTVHVVVVDENDNAPLVLHPAQESSPVPSELVPVSAEAGYLITKVVAVDADSGQNLWLSYHLLRATDPGLFVVGAQSGEVRLGYDVW